MAQSTAGQTQPEQPGRTSDNVVTGVSEPQPAQPSAIPFLAPPTVAPSSDPATADDTEKTATRGFIIPSALPSPRPSVIGSGPTTAGFLSPTFSTFSPLPPRPSIAELLALPRKQVVNKLRQNNVIADLLANWQSTQQLCAQIHLWTEAHAFQHKIIERNMINVCTGGQVFRRNAGEGGNGMFGSTSSVKPDAPSSADDTNDDEIKAVDLTGLIRPKSETVDEYKNRAELVGEYLDHIASKAADWMVEQMDIAVAKAEESDRRRRDRDDHASTSGAKPDGKKDKKSKDKIIDRFGKSGPTTKVSFSNVVATIGRKGKQQTDRLASQASSGMFRSAVQLSRTDSNDLVKGAKLDEPLSQSMPAEVPCGTGSETYRPSTSGGTETKSTTTTTKKKKEIMPMLQQGMKQLLSRGKVAASVAVKSKGAAKKAEVVTVVPTSMVASQSAVFVNPDAESPAARPATSPEVGRGSGSGSRRTDAVPPPAPVPPKTGDGGAIRKTRLDGKRPADIKTEPRPDSRYGHAGSHSPVNQSPPAPLPTPAIGGSMSSSSASSRRRDQTLALIHCCLYFLPFYIVSSQSGPAHFGSGGYSSNTADAARLFHRVQRLVVEKLLRTTKVFDKADPIHKLVLAELDRLERQTQQIHKTVIESMEKEFSLEYIAFPEEIRSEWWKQRGNVVSYESVSMAIDDSIRDQSILSATSTTGGAGAGAGGRIRDWKDGDGSLCERHMSCARDTGTRTILIEAAKVQVEAISRLRLVARPGEPETYAMEERYVALMLWGLGMCQHLEDLGIEMEEMLTTWKRLGGLRIRSAGGKGDEAGTKPEEDGDGSD